MHSPTSSSPNAPIPPSTASAELGIQISAEDQALVKIITEQFGMSEANIVLMVDAIRRGETAGEFFGIDDTVLAQFEQMAIGFYRANQFEDARRMFMAVLFHSVQLGTPKASAVRGLAACDHSEHFYLDAIELYHRALLLDEQDFISMGALSECLCHVGDTTEGIKMAHQLLSRVRHEDKQQPHVLRARALIQAKGGKPLPNAQRRRQQPETSPLAPTSNSAEQTVAELKEAASPTQHPAAELAAKVQAQGAESISREAWAEIAERAAEEAMEAIGQDDGKRPDFLAPLLAEPGAEALLAELNQAFFSGQLTIREIADFSDEQMDAAYAMGCNLASSGDFARALQLGSWMLYIDSHDPRFYRLCGLCMQHFKLWPLADFYFESARIWGKGQPDPATELYQGEVALMLGEPERAVRLLTAGLENAKGQVAFLPHTQRGKALLRQIAAGHMGPTAQGEAS